MLPTHFRLFGLLLIYKYIYLQIIAQSYYFFLILANIFSLLCQKSVFSPFYGNICDILAVNHPAWQSFTLTFGSIFLLAYLLTKKK